MFTEWMDEADNKIMEVIFHSCLTYYLSFHNSVPKTVCLGEMVIEHILNITGCRLGCAQCL